ncbi:hypothetical protein BU24DRAFT_461921 [Aaosphaeria arxii CBS 175.79]|uniref:Uncharacterized protein n=1 Tax=Aaosphaeria arxii CBS 175.79 TaxID=1450172 RepID=A0A6A5XSA6_9PLEO|nr:uncharacterized protein BU24DRAFT_461921 [Aaosphaeria arxii CBS 175.79]KAF2015687.1 hypothetical protein BU24DRAFT_461921 [Aaosphaeria arxii CBS 175.79]
MRYLRFLKTPRIVNGPKSSEPEISFLITITSDLGDSFLPYDVTLFAELIPESGGPIIASKKIVWGPGMRTLPISLPFKKSKVNGAVIVRVGTQPKISRDDFNSLLRRETRGIVSAFSAPIDPIKGTKEARKLVERRIGLGDSDTSEGKSEIRIWEETGESIARHLWDAGIAASSYLVEQVRNPTNDAFSNVFKRSKDNQSLRILELGTGCGMASMSLAQVLESTELILTDLSEAEEIVDHNLKGIKTASNTSASFLELDWEAELPSILTAKPIDIAMAADCTYNPDSSPALVNTISRISKQSPTLAVIIAMKFRHSSEEVFFDLMADAGFVKVAEHEIPLPGDEEPGEEDVHVYLFRHDSSRQLGEITATRQRRESNANASEPLAKKRRKSKDRN